MVEIIVEKPDAVWTVDLCIKLRGVSKGGKPNHKGSRVIKLCRIAATKNVGAALDELEERLGKAAKKELGVE